MKYLFSKCEILPNADKGDIAVIPEWAVQRWRRQMDTGYAQLSEQEKDSDRQEADFLLSLFPAEGPPKAEPDQVSGNPGSLVEEALDAYDEASAIRMDAGYMHALHSPEVLAAEERFRFARQNLLQRLRSPEAQGDVRALDILLDRLLNAGRDNRDPIIEEIRRLRGSEGQGDNP